MLRAIAAPSAHCVYRATSRPLATKARRPKRSKTEFITRRHTYRQQVHELRKQFADEFQAEKTETVQDELEDRQQRMEAKIERRERRK